MERPRYFSAVLGFLCSLPALLVAGQPSVAWIDPSPHSTRSITVDDGVQLEVLDWGGRGRPILLLAGLGDTAHVFDDFAPRLTDRHHVYGVTRRGFGNSSAPDSGYDFDRLAEDVIGVVDALGLEEPIVVGHSFAGEEMHILGNRHAAEVAALVYIDAAFNRADDSADYDAKLRELPRAPGPQPTDVGSIATLRDFRARNGMPPYPEAEIRNRYVVDAGGNIGSPRMPAQAVREGISAAMSEAVKEYGPEPIHIPALTIYAVPDRPEDLMRPWYDRNDASVQRTIQELFVLARERYRRHAEWFQSFAQGLSRGVGMSGDHHLFVTNAASVEEEIETFAASLD
jgi:pimeloyl-ACP methyl ester carboxylesterase